MKNRFVIDTSVYITYAAYNKIYRLADAIIEYELAVFLNRQLLYELEKNIPRALKITNATTADILAEIKAATLFVDTKPYFNQSPDPKDDFLFDLALQTDSEVIVSQEKALLGFAESPVAIHDLKWFKENYPVAL